METFLNMKVDTLILMGVCFVGGYLCGGLSMIHYSNKIAKRDAKLLGKDGKEGMYQ